MAVLYSRGQDAWKLADFGTAAEGTSQGTYTTDYARGTTSYRAPELIRNKGVYNH